MGRIFGTDGVRGVANGDLTPELAMNLGRAAGMVVEEATGTPPDLPGRQGYADLLRHA